jgi:hypothetical protein
MSAAKKTETAKKVAKVQQDLGMSTKDIENGFVHYLYNTLGRNVDADLEYQFRALSYAVRDRLIGYWKKRGMNITKLTAKKPITFRWSF